MTCIDGWLCRFCLFLNHPPIIYHNKALHRASGCHYLASQASLVFRGFTALPLTDWHLALSSTRPEAWPKDSAPSFSTLASSPGPQGLSFVFRLCRPGWLTTRNLMFSCYYFCICVLFGFAVFEKQTDKQKQNQNQNKIGSSPWLSLSTME